MLIMGVFHLSFEMSLRVSSDMTTVEWQFVEIHNDSCEFTLLRPGYFCPAKIKRPTDNV